jgi:hypothetical protein
MVRDSPLSHIQGVPSYLRPKAGSPAGRTATGAKSLTLAPGAEGIVSKSKNPAGEAVRREREDECDSSVAILPCDDA